MLPGVPAAVKGVFGMTGRWSSAVSCRLARMRVRSATPTPGPVLDALDEVAQACGVDPVTVVVPAKQVASLAHINSRTARITLNHAVAAAAHSEPEMIRFLLSHELGHRARSTKSWMTLVGGVLLMVMGVWLIVVASFEVAEVTSDRVQWVFAWTYGASLMLFVGA